MLLPSICAAELVVSTSHGGRTPKLHSKQKPAMGKTGHAVATDTQARYSKNHYVPISARLGSPQPRQRATVEFARLSLPVAKRTYLSLPRDFGALVGSLESSRMPSLGHKFWVTCPSHCHVAIAAAQLRILVSQPNISAPK